jgi:hypothetical protein
MGATGNNGLWLPGTGKRKHSQGKEVFRLFSGQQFSPWPCKNEISTQTSSSKGYATNDGHTYSSHISISLPEGPDVPVETYDAMTASKMLGIHFSPARNSSMHVEHMVQKGMDWVDCLLHG